MRNFSSIAAPLHALTSFKSPFSGSPQAKTAFQRLKRSFITASVLMLPDPLLQDVGIGGGAL